MANQYKTACRIIRSPLIADIERLRPIVDATQNEVGRDGSIQNVELWIALRDAAKAAEEYLKCRTRAATLLDRGAQFAAEIAE